MVSKDVDSAALINIDNHNFDGEGLLQPGQLFFQSVVEFKDKFTQELPKYVRDKIQTITVKTDFNNIPDDAIDEIEKRLCSQSFRYLGLKEILHVRFPELPRKGESTDQKWEIFLISTIDLQF